MTGREQQLESILRLVLPWLIDIGQEPGVSVPRCVVCRVDMSRDSTDPHAAGCPAKTAWDAIPREQVIR